MKGIVTRVITLALLVGIHFVLGADVFAQDCCPDTCAAVSGCGGCGSSDCYGCGGGCDCGDGLGCGGGCGCGGGLGLGLRCGGGLGCAGGFGCGGYRCDPLLAVKASGVILHRSPAQAGTLVEDARTSLELVNVEDLDLEWGAGMRIEAVGVMPNGWGIEGVYFAVDNWTTSMQLAGGNLRIPMFSPTEVFDNLYGEYGSDLYNAELNLRRPLTGHLTALAGFRWTELQEYGFASGFSPAGYSWGSVNIENNLYGFQLGAEAALGGRSCNRLRVDGFVKAGVYGNSVERLATGVRAFGSGTTTIYDSHLAFVGEAAIRAAYQLTDVLSVFGGYEAMWLDGVALAPNQQAWNDQIIFGGTVLYHGAMAGVQAEW